MSASGCPVSFCKFSTSCIQPALVEKSSSICVEAANSAIIKKSGLAVVDISSLRHAHKPRKDCFMSDAIDRAGIAATFEALLKPILGAAYGVAYQMTRNREEAEDVIQEATILAFRG